MDTDIYEAQVHRIASQFSWIQHVETVDKTAHAVKLRLAVSNYCFVQVYANLQKGLFNYVLILGRGRLYGRDCDGGKWHRHPYDDPQSHDFSADGAKAVTLEEFLIEVEDALHQEGLL